jgi:type III pantothenate kinase
MLLAIDIGNTNIVFGFFDKQGVIKKTLRLETKRKPDKNYFKDFFIKNKINEKRIKSVIVSSVVPSIDESLKLFCKNFLKVPAFFVNENIYKLGIKIDLKTPNEIGADRLVNAIAFFNKYKKAGIIIDFGTATTFDVVNEKGDYLGGMICPGVNLACDALSKAAAKLPKIKIDKPKEIIGKSTVSAMQSGIYFGYLGLIEGNVKKISLEMKQNGLKKDIMVIATGGLARFFSETDVVSEIDENLTLEGLYFINKKLKL